MQSSTQLRRMTVDTWYCKIQQLQEVAGRFEIKSISECFDRYRCFLKTCLKISAFISSEDQREGVV